MKLLREHVILVILSLASINLSAQIDSLIKYVSQDKYVVSIQTKNEYVNVSSKRNAYIDSIRTARYYTSAHYFYLLLDSVATNDKLIELISHESPIVQAYAAEAIAYRDTLLLPMVITKMLDNYSSVAIRTGSVVMGWTTASQVFTGLSNRRSQTGLPTQSFIDKLDSIYISHKNTPSLDIGIKLNSLRSKALNPVIEKVVLERKDIHAIAYLYNWYKADYYHLLNNAYLDILDSCTIEWFTPNINGVIIKIIELNDKETLKKLGAWLKNNRKKWVGIKDIDKTLDRSYIIQDSIGWTDDRYPFDSVDVDFLLGEWIVASGMDDNYKLGDTVVLVRSLSKKKERKRNHRKIAFNLKPNGLFSHYDQKVSDDKVNRVGSPSFDPINNRICTSTYNWNWYKIIQEEDKLIFIKE